MNDSQGNAVLQGEFYMVMEGSVSTPNAARHRHFQTGGFIPPYEDPKVTAVNPPKVTHKAYQTAEAEAQRLAKENPGKTFFVLKAHSKYVAKHIEKTVF